MRMESLGDDFVVMALVDLTRYATRTTIVRGAKDVTQPVSYDWHGSIPSCVCSVCGHLVSCFCLSVVSPPNKSHPRNTSDDFFMCHFNVPFVLLIPDLTAPHEQRDRVRPYKNSGYLSVKSLKASCLRKSLKCLHVSFAVNSIASESL